MDRPAGKGQHVSNPFAWCKSQPTMARSPRFLSEISEFKMLKEICKNKEQATQSRNVTRMISSDPP